MAEVDDKKAQNPMRQTRIHKLVRLHPSSHELHLPSRLSLSAGNIFFLWNFFETDYQLQRWHQRRQAHQGCESA
jgi:hypothetical protein